MTSIRLDDKHGVNPSVTLCPVCYHDCNEIILPGKSYIMKCSNDHKFLFAIGQGRNKCPVCGEKGGRVHEFDGYKHKVLSTQPCDKCAAMLKTHNIVVCTSCRQMFTATAHRVTKSVPEEHLGKDGPELEKLGYAEKVIGKVQRTEGCDKCKPELFGKTMILRPKE